MPRTFRVSSLLCAWSLFVFLTGCTASDSRTSDQVCFKNKCFNVEIASDEEQRIKGLQLRRLLDEDKGMLFVFPQEGLYPFWMKSTLIPLDIVWLDYSRR